MTRAAIDRSRLGVVVVGRNEGERLQRCLDALAGAAPHVVYVDSGSSDDSVEQARKRGFEAVELDRSAPFTAARGRNAGVARLLELDPQLEYVQFLDGDCVLDPDWLPAAFAALTADPRVGAVCGRRREMHPDRSVYNRLCDAEWDTEIGGGADVGGDSLMRIDAFQRVGGFDPRLIAGEDPELSMRLRAAGFDIQRIPAEMTLHDAAILRFGQWWDRAIRTGYTSAQWRALRDTDLGRTRRRRERSALFWALCVPLGWLASIAVLRALSLSWALAVGAPTLLAAAAYARLVLRIRSYRIRRGADARSAGEYARYCVLAKAPEAQGVVRYALDVLRGKRPKLIEYKAAERPSGAGGGR